MRGSTENSEKTKLIAKLDVILYEHGKTATPCRNGGTSQRLSVRFLWFHSDLMTSESEILYLFQGETVYITSCGIKSV